MSRFFGFGHEEEKARASKVYISATPAKQLKTCFWPYSDLPRISATYSTYPGRTNRLIWRLSRAKNVDVNRLMHFLTVFFLWTA